MPSKKESSNVQCGQTQISEHPYAGYLCCLGHYRNTSSLWEVLMSKALLEQPLQPATNINTFISRRCSKAELEKQI
jgi:hypothetical protein